jgi:hypothetical protein
VSLNRDSLDPVLVSDVCVAEPTGFSCHHIVCCMGTGCVCRLAFCPTVLVATCVVKSPLCAKPKTPLPRNLHCSSTGRTSNRTLSQCLPCAPVVLLSSGGWKTSSLLVQTALLSGGFVRQVWKSFNGGGEDRKAPQ